MRPFANQLRRIFRIPHHSAVGGDGETLMELKTVETTGMVVLQAESEISSINMVNITTAAHRPENG